MDGEINLLTLLSLVVAVVAIIKLRSLLGRRTEEDDTRIQRKREAMSKQVAGAQSDKVVTLPRRDRELEATEQTVSVAEVEERIKAFAGADTQLATRLMDILRLDSKFEPDTFLRGAKQAYEMIVTAFAEGKDRKSVV